jgi:E3 ubiquitin-protein ligase RNF14
MRSMFTCVQDMLEILRLRQTLIDEAIVRKSSKSCPHCGAAIEKTAGCNKVVCALCKGAMCWICNAAIEGYAHFRTEACKLLDEAQTLEWEREWELLVQQAARNEQLAPVNGELDGQMGHAVPGMRCLQCGQFCIKVARNNHVKCIWCRADCCFHCNTLLQGRRVLKEHFGVNKCPQHT